MTSFIFRITAPLLVVIILFNVSGLDFSRAQSLQVAQTSITVGICGDGIVHVGQDCDFGTDPDTGESLNTGGYSITIDGRQCNPDCTWAPYCGDNILQSSFGEECDDGTNTDEGFCTADCKEIPRISPEGTGGGAGGGGGSFPGGEDVAPADTRVRIQGKAYPHSAVNVLKDGIVIGVVSADADANFTFTSGQITPGTATFGFWAEDSSGLRSISFTTTFEVVQSAVTTISGVFLPPTIDIANRSVSRGDIVNVRGQSVPEVDIRTEVHSEPQFAEMVQTDEQGNWTLAFDTSPLSEDVHTARAQFTTVENGVTVESGFSQRISFFVGVGDRPGMSIGDLNGDGLVNLIDFSILLFHWGTSNPAADINGDGNVGIADFSIMLFNWTG